MELYTMQMREELIEALKDHILAVSFTKADGTIRRMMCTLNAAHLPVITENDVDRREYNKHSLDVIAVWDLEKNDWRAFRVDSVLEVEGV
jgi:hypothetical protein